MFYRYQRRNMFFLSNQKDNILLKKFKDNKIVSSAVKCISIRNTFVYHVTIQQ